MLLNLLLIYEGSGVKCCAAVVTMCSCRDDVLSQDSEVALSFSVGSENETCSSGKEITFFVFTKASTDAYLLVFNKTDVAKQQTL